MYFSFRNLPFSIGSNALSPSCIHHLFQFFPDLEEWEFLWRDIHDLPSLWISAFVAPVISHHKASKSSDLNSLPLLQTFLHPVEEGIHNDLGDLLCHIRLLGDLCNKFSLIHSSSLSPHLCLPVGRFSLSH